MNSEKINQNDRLIKEKSIKTNKNSNNENINMSNNYRNSLNE